ncbi:MAG: DUF6089 family protein [Bacteroidia bacterium]|nr:DUF6089 family protein [Bacteroidia bacterium]
MKYKTFTLSFTLLILCLSGFSQKQRKAIFYTGSGIITYYGDLTDRVNFSYWNPVVQIGAGYYLNEYLQIRGELLRGRVEADDKDANDQGRILRDLRFRNNISEFNLMMQLEILPDRSFRGPYSRTGHFTPYVLAGIAGFYHNPKGFLEGEWYALQPLGTEGQLITTSGMEPYSRWQLSIPFGLGLSYRFEQAFIGKIEMVYRKTFTDYLDDVSTNYPNAELLRESSGDLGSTLSRTDIYPFEDGFKRGNPDKKDGYMLFTLSVGYLIR